MKSIPGYIEWLLSGSTGKEFPHLVFAADVDYVTIGMVSLTSIECPEVVVTMATSDEWNNYNPSVIQKRVNEELNRSDLRYIHLQRTEKPLEPTTVESIRKLAKYQKNLENPKGIFRFMSKKRMQKNIDRFKSKPVYIDIFDQNHEACLVRTESLKSFQAGEGLITRHNF